MSDHYQVMYACGEHAKSQCRCPSLDKAKKPSDTPCPFCILASKPMTSPPLTETGPSPEAGLMSTPEFKALLDEMILEAKRSAHLEDARAGCMGCRLGEEMVTMGQPVARYHSHGALLSPCARPEVWDALALLPPKGTR